MKKIYLFTFLTLLLAKYCYAEGKKPHYLFFELNSDDVSESVKCPEGHLTEKDGMLLFGNTEKFYFSEILPITAVEEFCTYKTSFFSSTAQLSNEFVLKKTIIRFNCTNSAFNGVVTHTLKRSDDKLFYDNQFLNDHSKVVSEFKCQYQK